MSDPHDRNRNRHPQPDGAFPLTGPVTYLTDDEDAARALLDHGEFPEPTTWWHATYLASLPQSWPQGLCLCAGAAATPARCSGSTRSPTFRAGDATTRFSKSEAQPCPAR
jgi:hypothetical protein